MAYSFTEKKRIRKNFGKVNSVAALPSLLEIQKDSFSAFLEPKSPTSTAPCLEDAFKAVFPIKDNAGVAELDFVNYSLDQPKFDVEECIQRDMTFASPMKGTLRLTVWEVDEETEARSVKDIKEQEV